MAQGAQAQHRPQVLRVGFLSCGRLEWKMQIRKAHLEDAPAIARVHVDSWRQTYAGILSTEFLASLSYSRREEMWHSLLSSSSDTVTFVAVTPSDQIVGFIAAGPEREGDPLYRGEIYAIYLLKEHWRKGLGSRLFVEAARDLRQRGYPALLVWVLKDNPSRRFYEALGGVYLREKDIQIGEQLLLEVAYGWKDTAQLLVQRGRLDEGRAIHPKEDSPQQ